MSRLKLAVLISGRGSNMGALARATMDPDYPAEIVLVLSNRPHVEGLELAQEHGLPVRVIDHTEYPDRDAHEAAVSAALDDCGADLVCMAGYMRIVGDEMLGRWRGKLLNIHPSLLPSFRGVDTHARALEAGVRAHGCSVHFVIADLDAGPIVAQAVVPVEPHDTEETLASRVLDAEHRLYPHAVALIAADRVRWSGDDQVIDRNTTSADLLLLPTPAA